MSVIRHRKGWIARLDRNRDHFRDLLAEDPFRNWAQRRRPEIHAQGYLLDGLEILYAKPGSKAGRQHLQRCVEVAQRALQECDFSAPPYGDFYPLNQAKLLRAWCYARAILGERLDKTSLEQAAAAYEEWGLSDRTANLWGMKEGDWEAVVRLGLLAEDWPRVRRLLPELKTRCPEQDLFRAVMNPVRNPAPLRTCFEKFFNEVRNPAKDLRTEAGTLRLELAAIRDKFLVSRSGILSWKRVIASISA